MQHDVGGDGNGGQSRGRDRTGSLGDLLDNKEIVSSLRLPAQLLLIGASQVSDGTPDLGLQPPTSSMRDALADGKISRTSRLQPQGSEGSLFRSTRSLGEQLRAVYDPENAIIVPGNPNHAPLYSDINLIKRESLKFHPEVKPYKEQMWELTHAFGHNAAAAEGHHSVCCSGACCPCCGIVRGGGTGNAHYIAQPSYALLHHKIVLAVLGNAVDPADELVIAEKDWRADMVHQQRRDPESVLMNRSTFFISIHRLIDLWTEEIDQDEYIRFTAALFDRITVIDEENNRQFRDDDQICQEQERWQAERDQRRREREQEGLGGDGEGKTDEITPEAEARRLRREEYRRRSCTDGDRPVWGSRVHMKGGTGLGGHPKGSGQSTEDKEAMAALRLQMEEARLLEEADIARRQAERRLSMLRRGAGSGGGQASGERSPSRWSGVNVKTLISLGREGTEELKRRDALEENMRQARLAEKKHADQAARRAARLAQHEAKEKADRVELDAKRARIKQAALKRGGRPSTVGHGEGRRGRGGSLDMGNTSTNGAAATAAEASPSKWSGVNVKTLISLGHEGTEELKRRDALEENMRQARLAEKKHADQAARRAARLARHEAKEEADRVELDAKRARIKQAALKKGGRRHSEVADEALRERFRRRSRRRSKLVVQQSGNTKDGDGGGDGDSSKTLSAAGLLLFAAISDGAGKAGNGEVANGDSASKDKNAGEKLSSAGKELFALGGTNSVSPESSPHSGETLSPPSFPPPSDGGTEEGVTSQQTTQVPEATVAKEVQELQQQSQRSTSELSSAGQDLFARGSSDGANGGDDGNHGDYGAGNKEIDARYVTLAPVSAYIDENSRRSSTGSRVGGSTVARCGWEEADNSPAPRRSSAFVRRTPDDDCVRVSPGRLRAGSVGRGRQSARSWEEGELLASLGAHGIRPSGRAGGLPHVHIGAIGATGDPFGWSPDASMIHPSLASSPASQGPVRSVSSSRLAPLSQSPASAHVSGEGSVAVFPGDHALFPKVRRTSTTGATSAASAGSIYEQSRGDPRRSVSTSV